MSALQNALRPALTPALGSARRGVSRYFTEFNPVAEVYVSLGSQVSLTSQYEISCDFYVPDNTTERTLFGNSVNNSYLSLRADGNIRFRGTDGVIEQTTSPVYEGGKLSNIRVVKGASNVSMILNGVVVYDDMSNANFLLDYIGRYSASAFFFDGIIANFKVWSGGDRDAGSLILHMPINRYYTPQSNTVLDESGSSNNGTFVNIAAGRSKYYQQRADGNFVDLQGNVLEVAY